MKRRCLSLFAAVAMLATLAVVAAPVSAEKEWQALPAETVFALRVPDGQAFINQMRQQTRLGQVLLSDERIDAFAEIIKTQDAEGFDEMKAGMEKYGLKTGDLIEMMKGEAGLAMLMEQPAAEGEDPPVYVLMYSNPGKELADKLMKAMKDSLAEQTEEKKEGRTVRRIDEKVGGLDAIHVITDKSETKTDFSFEGGEFKQVETEFIERTHGMVAQDGGRLLFAFSGAVEIVEDADKKVAEQRAEAAKGYFARFVTGQSSGFAKKVSGVKGLKKAMPGGTGMMEMYIDGGQLMQLAKQSVPEERGKEMFSKLGLDNVGMMAMRGSLKGDQLWGNFFMATPGQRKGVLSFLDQKKLEPTIPGWVPAGATQYGHLSFDLGDAYTKIKQMVMDIQGPDAAGMFQMAEGQIQMFAGAPLPAVLSSLGQKHAVVSFAPPAGAAAAIENDNLEDQMALNRMAMVWELTDEKVWTRLFQSIAQMSQNQPNAPMKKVDEQGFTGFRMNQSPVETGVFVGKKHLIFAMGEGVPAQMLAAIAKPPAGKNAMKNAEFVKQGNKILDPKPGLSYGVVDMDRQMQAQHAMMIAIAKKALLQEGADQATVDKLIEAMPTAKELEGAFGVNAGQMYVDDAGLIYEAMFQLPPAK